MPKITFLEGSHPLVKRYDADGVTPYPNVKQVTSHTEELGIHDLERKLELYQNASKKGWCLFKGHPTRPLLKESRAGMVNKDATTQQLVLDIDGITILGKIVPTPLTREVVADIAEAIVADLPPPFQGVSYIAHASSSMGMKGHKVSMHLDFWLDCEVLPAALKQYITKLNLDIPLFANNMELNGSQLATTFPLDRCIVDNSRMIFIAHPKFSGVPSPFEKDDDRWVLVRKDSDTVPLIAEVAELDISKITNRLNSKVNELRARAGLGRGSLKKVKLRTNGFTETVLTNPDQGSMVLHQDYGPYVTYNINGGDSHAYYVNKDTPHIVRNWKGEDNFLFNAVDSDAYQAHLETFGITSADGETTACIPMVFRDMEADKLYQLMYDPNRLSYEKLHKITRNETQDYMAYFGHTAPEPMPQWKLGFEPQNPVVIDTRQGFVNMYKPCKLITEPADIPAEYIDLGYGEAGPALMKLCPTIYTLMDSLLGNGKPEIEHFVNWLAYILQFREKAKTAWIFHGTQGTGKGMFTSRVLAPLVQDDHYHQMEYANLEDNFTGWVRGKFLAVVDEFKLKHDGSGDQIFNRLKGLITEERSALRKMQTEQEMERNYLSLIFLSNEHDLIRIPDDDRRFNVAPRQEQSMNQRHGEGCGARMLPQIQKELPLFASLLAQFDVDVGKSSAALDNLAKAEVREAYESALDLYINAFRDGDLGFLGQVMNMKVDYSSPSSIDNNITTSQNYFRAWINLDIEPGEVTRVETTQMLPFAHLLASKGLKEFASFALMLRKRGLKVERSKRHGVNYNYVNVIWDTTDLEELRKAYTIEDGLNAHKSPVTSLFCPENSG